MMDESEGGRTGGLLHLFAIIFRLQMFVYCLTTSEYPDVLRMGKHVIVMS
jgi:hypothetical protein